MSRKVPSKYDVGRALTTLIQVTQRFGWECGKGVLPRSDREVWRAKKAVDQAVERLLVVARDGVEGWLKLHPIPSPFLSPFRKGDRVRMVGTAHHTGARMGVVVATPRQAKHISVLRDGLKTPAQYSVKRWRPSEGKARKRELAL